MRSFPFLALISFLLVQGAAPAAAQNSYHLGDLEPGQVLLNLSASERVQVEQDTLQATLEFSVQGRDKEALQDEVNRTMTEAVGILEAEAGDDVEFSTLQYHVYIFQAGRPTRADVESPLWRAQQSVRLESKDSGALLELAGRLQEAGLHITSLYYSLSTEKYEETADTLMASALAKLQARAEAAAEALGKSSASLVEVSLDGNQGFPVFREARMAMSAADSAEMAPPVATPGQTDVSLTVSARALLSP